MTKSTGEKVTKLMRAMNYMPLKTCIAKVNELCTDPDYIEKSGDDTTVPLTKETISGWRTGRINIRNAHVKSIVRFCNSTNLTPNDVIENPLSPEGRW